ncbi:hypothetical protein OXX69_001240 [Metschnikowia pulcherrima]
MKHTSIYTFAFVFVLVPLISAVPILRRGEFLIDHTYARSSEQEKEEFQDCFLEHFGQTFPGIIPQDFLECITRDEDTDESAATFSGISDTACVIRCLENFIDRVFPLTKSEKKKPVYFNPVNENSFEYSACPLFEENDASFRFPDFDHEHLPLLDVGYMDSGDEPINVNIEDSEFAENSGMSDNESTATDELTDEDKVVDTRHLHTLYEHLFGSCLTMGPVLSDLEQTN